MSSFRDDIERLSKQWDKALQQGIFDDVKKQGGDEGQREVDFFGQMPTVYNTDIKDSDMEKWSDVMSTLKNRETNSFDDEMLNEESVPSNKKKKKHAKKMANTNNPVYPNTRGKDNKINPKTDFAGGPNLDKLIELKGKLHDLKVQLTKDENLGKNVDKIESSVDRMSKEIDKLSDMLNGNIIDNK